jgi:hypothetical protein
MCMVSYLPPGTAVDVDGLFNGGLHNPHGHGWAVVTAGTVIIGKSLDLADALDEFSEVRERYPQGPALFHSRWATHGGMGVDNVHPFVVGGSAATVVAHNGILPKAAHPKAGDDRSDTRKFADEILSRQFRRLDRGGVQRALSQWCGLGNKLVILSVDPRYRRSAYLVNEAAGQWDDRTGIWHSNTDYEAYPSWGQASGSSAGSAFAGDCCAVCGYGLIDGNGYCDECRSCQDCVEHIRYCLCWNRHYMAG